MAYEVTIKHDQSVDRFRAYGEVGVRKSPSLADHIARFEAGMPPFQHGAVVAHTVEDVILEGNVKGDSLNVDARDNRISRVVLYMGDVENQVVVGSVDVNASGKIVVGIVSEPADE